jgi:peptide chain release factor 3
MVIDAAKGIEPQTRKLFEVCRLRNVPIITFVNKVDREGRDPFETARRGGGRAGARCLPDELAGRHGRHLRGHFDFATGKLRQPSGPSREFEGDSGEFSGIDDAGLETVLSADGLAKLREEGELAQAGYEPFDLAAYRMAT